MMPNFLIRVFNTFFDFSKLGKLKKPGCPKNSWEKRQKFPCREELNSDFYYYLFVFKNDDSFWKSFRFLIELTHISDVCESWEDLFILRLNVWFHFSCFFFQKKMMNFHTSRLGLILFLHDNNSFYLSDIILKNPESIFFFFFEISKKKPDEVPEGILSQFYSSLE